MRSILASTTRRLRLLPIGAQLGEKLPERVDDDDGLAEAAAHDIVALGQARLLRAAAYLVEVFTGNADAENGILVHG